MAENNKIIYYDSSTGLHRITKSEIKTKLKEVITSAYGNDVLLDDNYPDGIVINGLTEMIDTTLNTVETIYNMLDINNAEGVALDTLGNIRNEHRKEATESILYVNITVSISEPEASDVVCTFSENTLTLKDESNNYWYISKTSEDTDLTITIPAGQTSASGVGTFTSSGVTGVMQEPTTLEIASISSSVPVDQNNISLLITNFKSGENEESDIEFRNRMNKYAVYNSITLKENLSNNLIDLNYIKDIKIYYNNSTLNLKTKGDIITVPPGKMIALIKPEKNVTSDPSIDPYASYFDDNYNPDKRQEVFNVIENYKGLGTLCYLPLETLDPSDPSYNPSDPETTIDPEIGKGYISKSGDPLSYDYLAEFLVPATYYVERISISYTKTNNFDSTLSDPTDPSSDPVGVVNIKNIVKLYIDSLGIGKNLTQKELVNYISSNTNEIDLEYLEIDDLVGGVSTAVGRLVNNDKILAIDLDDITLEEIV